MKKDRTVFIIVGAMILTIIIMLSLRGCSRPKVSVEKNDDNLLVGYNDEGVGDANELWDRVEERQNGVGSGVVGSEEVGSVNESEAEVCNELEEGNESEASSESEIGNETVVDNETEGSISETNGYVGMKKVDGYADLVENFESDVIISSKNLYLLDNGVYAYSLGLIVPFEGDYKIIDYMCSLSSWNSVDSGETIHISYGVDSSGNILITSISKNNQ